MSSNHRGRRPGTRRSEDARRQSAGVRRFFFANNSSASPAEDVLGLVPLTGGRRAVLPSMDGRSFTAPHTREALRAERRAAAARAAQDVLKVAFCSFLDQLPSRLPPRPSTNPTFTPFLTQTPIMLTKELLQLPNVPSLLAQRCNYGVNFLNITTYVSLLSVDGAWFASGLYHTFIARTNPNTLRGLARALSESALQSYIVEKNASCRLCRNSPKRALGSLEVSLGQKEKSGFPVVRLSIRTVQT